MRIGAVSLQPVSDGTFVARPEYFGASGSRDSHPELFGGDGAAWLPIGCFLLRAGQRLVLIDAGLGPDLQHLPYNMLLVGGQLLTGLRPLGVNAGDITDVFCSHLHVDHVGWLFDAEAKPVFAGADIWLGEGDWHHFVAGADEMLPHIRAGFRDQLLWLELEDERTIGTGAHFPELRFGRVSAGTGRRWHANAGGDLR